MVNVNKLKGKIVEKGFKITELAEMIGIAPSTLYRKLGNNGTALTIKEADMIVKSLNLTSAEANSIFFSQLIA